jgi:hypothetical protein
MKLLSKTCIHCEKTLKTAKQRAIHRTCTQFHAPSGKSLIVLKTSLLLESINSLLSLIL